VPIMRPQARVRNGWKADVRSGRTAR
jgi:hypothetical protein